MTVYREESGDISTFFFICAIAGQRGQLIPICSAQCFPTRLFLSAAYMKSAYWHSDPARLAQSS